MNLEEAMVKGYDKHMQLMEAAEQHVVKADEWINSFYDMLIDEEDIYSTGSKTMEFHQLKFVCTMMGLLNKQKLKFAYTVNEIQQMLSKNDKTSCTCTKNLFLDFREEWPWPDVIEKSI